MIVNITRAFIPISDLSVTVKTGTFQNGTQNEKETVGRSEVLQDKVKLKQSRGSGGGR